MGKLGENKVVAWPTPLLGEWLLEAENARRWLVPGLIPECGVTLISGPAKRAGKSYFAFTTAMAIASGKPFGIWAPTEASPVLYIDEEGVRASTRDRWRAIAKTMEVDVAKLPIFFSYRQQFKFDDPKWKKLLELKIKETGARAVIFDALTHMHKGDPNEEKHMESIFAQVRVVGNMGAAGIVLAHTNRAEDPKIDVDLHLRGSSAIGGAYDSHIALRRYKDTDPVIQLHLKFKDYDIQRYNVRWDFDNDNEGVVQTAKMNVEDPKRTRATETAKMVQLLQRNQIYSSSRLAAIWGISSRRTKVFVEELVEQHVVQPAEDGSGFQLIGSTQKDAGASHATPTELRAEREGDGSHYQAQADGVQSPARDVEPPALRGKRRSPLRKVSTDNRKGRA